jgi:hypothetical protein
MILTFGYQSSTPASLEMLVRDFDARVIDVRTEPRSRIRGFGRRQIERLLGGRYEWRGDQLGGRYLERDSAGKWVQRTEWTVGVPWLVERAQHENLILLCLETCPGICHRHPLVVQVARQLGPGACFHVYPAEGEAEVLDVLDLQRAIEESEDAEYPFEYYTSFRARVHAAGSSAGASRSAI